MSDCMIVPMIICVWLSNFRYKTYYAYSFAGEANAIVGTEQRGLAKDFILFGRRSSSAWRGNCNVEVRASKTIVVWQ